MRGDCQVPQARSRSSTYLCTANARSRGVSLREILNWRQGQRKKRFRVICQLARPQKRGRSGDLTNWVHSQDGRPPALRFGLFLVFFKSHYFLATTLGSHHGHQIPEIEGAGELSLLVECSHRSRQRRKGCRERHTSPGCVQYRCCPSHHD